MTDATQSPGRTRLPRRILAFRLLLAHYGLYAVTNVLLLIINVFTTPGNWWFLWVAWGWGILVAAHAGFFVRGWFGANVGAWAVSSVGLLVIDLIYSDRRWFYWPVLAWGLLLVVHGLFSARMRRRYVAWEGAMFGREPEDDRGQRPPG